MFEDYPQLRKKQKIPVSCPFYTKNQSLSLLSKLIWLLVESERFSQYFKSTSYRMGIVRVYFLQTFFLGLKAGKSF